MAILSVIQAAKPNANLWSHVEVRFALPFWAINVPLMAIMTIGIVFRLLSVRRSVAANLGVDSARVYTSVAAMVVESAALESIAGVICLITYVTHSVVENAIQPALGQIAVSHNCLVYTRS